MDLTLDESLYDPSPEEVAFLKSQTGIQDAQELKRHVIATQAEAYEVYKYPCIQKFSFLNLKISRLPAYPAVLKLGREREGAIFLDLGCCFGNDTRKIVSDGFPVENVVASDLRSEFWECGHKLYKSTPESFPARFIACDAFSLGLADGTAQKQRPLLKEIRSLDELRGHISAIHTSSFFHLFSEEKQLEMARIVASLLSPEPGSVIFGMHVGKFEKGIRQSLRSGHTMFCHSAESWKELWDGVVFSKGSVKVNALITPYVSALQTAEILVWSVTRM